MTAIAISSFEKKMPVKRVVPARISSKFLATTAGFII